MSLEIQRKMQSSMVRINNWRYWEWWWGGGWGDVWRGNLSWSGHMRAWFIKDAVFVCTLATLNDAVAFCNTGLLSAPVCTPLPLNCESIPMSWVNLCMREQRWWSCIENCFTNQYFEIDKAMHSEQGFRGRRKRKGSFWSPEPQNVRQHRSALNLNWMIYYQFLQVNEVREGWLWHGGTSSIWAVDVPPHVRQCSLLRPPPTVGQRLLEMARYQLKEAEGVWNLK